MRTSPLVLFAALALAATGSACQNHGDEISMAKDPGRPNMSSGGLGNLGGGNDMPDGSHGPDPDSGIMKWADAGAVPDGGLPNQEGQCAGESQAAKQVPLDLLLLVDRSGSMTDQAPGGKTKWEMAQTALTSFVQDPKSDGLGVGLQFFPQVVSCTGEMDCGFPGTASTAPACLEERACIGSSGLLTGLPRLCGGRREAPCPLGTQCLPIGRCGLSGTACTMVGLPCPTMMIGDNCEATPKTCRDMPAAMCNAGDYANLAVPFGDLPGAAPALSLTLARTMPYGGTPTDPAATAALAELRTRATAHPERKEILILVTDGLPNSCSATPVTFISDLIAKAQMDTPPISTYAIGVFAPDDLANGNGQMALNQWATAGGTGLPFILNPNDDLTKQLQDALDQIRGAALPCEYTIPMPPSGMLDYMKVNVHVTGASTGTKGTDLGYVAKAESCDPTKGGWYYDVDPTTGGTPTRVIMCETTCKKFKMDVDAKIELRFGCKTIVIQ
jgi:hypothetical protein